MKNMKRQPLAFVLILVLASMFTGCTCGQMIIIPGVEFSESEKGGVKDAGPDARPEPAMPDTSPEPTPDATETVADTGEVTPEKVAEEKADEPILTVAKTSFVLSRSIAKGSKEVEALELHIGLNEVSDGMLRGLTLRLYADSKGGAEFSPTGDTDASTVIASVSLYDENNKLMADPQPLKLIDSTSDGFTPDQDFYQVTFNKLSLKLARGRTDKVIVKIDLLSNFTSRRFVAIGLKPQTDVVVTDESDRIISKIVGGPINMNTPHNPELTILDRGTLSISAELTFSQKILVGGQQQLIGRYKILAEGENFHLNRLTVANDMTGVIGDNIAETPIADTLIIKCLDMNGIQRSAQATPNNGEATFSGLPCFVPKDKTIELELWIDPRVVSGEFFELSGKQARFGIRGIGNSSTFEAIGGDSSVTINQPDSYVNEANIATYTLRRARPNFKPVTQPSTLMPTPGKPIYSWEVCAEGGDVGIARYNAIITTNGLDKQAADVYEFKVYNLAGQVSTATIIGSTNQLVVDLSQKGLADLYPNQSGVANGTYSLVIAFQNEEIISQGMCKQYQVRANIVGATTDDTISFEFQGAKELPLSLGNSCRNPLTGQIYGDLGAIYLKSESFVQEHFVNTSVLWSDFSGGLTDSTGLPMSAVHTYPLIQNGKVKANSSTCDWTNGQGTNFASLTPWNFKK